jgi:NitT/TauT family transport system substrate-binding protein
MLRFPRSRVWVTALVMMLIIVMFVPVAGCSKKPSVKGKTLRMAFSSAPEAIDVVGYKTAEILKEQGINVQVIMCDGGPKATQAILAGQADIASNTLNHILNSKMLAFALCRPKNMYTLVGAKDMKTIEDLKGKTLGAADPGSIANIIADNVFDKRKIPRDSVRRLQIGGNGARAAALLAGKVSGVWVYGGNHIKLRLQGYPTLAAVATDFPDICDDMWGATPEWLKKNEDLAVAVAKAQLQAAKWFKDKPDEWLAMALAKVEGLDKTVAQELYKALKEVDMYPLDGLLSAQSLQTTLNFLSQDGSIPKDTKIESFATLKYMDQARKEMAGTK